MKRKTRNTTNDGAKAEENPNIVSNTLAAIKLLLRPNRSDA